MPPTKSKPKSKSKYSRTDPSVSASSIFEVDTCGSASIRHSILYGTAAGRARKGVQRALRADQILNEPLAHGPPAMTGRVRGATRELTKSTLLTAVERKRLEQMVIRTSHGSGINSIDPEKRNGTAAAVKPPPTPASDIWQPNCSTKSVLSVKPPSSLRPNETMTQVLQTVPATGLMAIPLPHPGQSYNPTLDDHQEILRKTLGKLEEEQRDIEKATQIQQRITQGLKLSQAKSPWEDCEEDVGDGESDEDKIPSNPDSLSKEVIKKKIVKPKTKAQRKRQQKERQEVRMQALRKEAKSFAHSLHELPKLVRGLSTAEREARRARAAQKAKRAALIAEYGLQAIRGGKPKGLKAVEGRYEYQLTDDLTETGLRGLKPEGNLWRDWSQSNMRRGKLDARAKIGLIKGQKFQKGRMFKEVEKHAWKNFEA